MGLTGNTQKLNAHISGGAWDAHVSSRSNLVRFVVLENQADTWDNRPVGLKRSYRIKYGDL